MIVIRLVMTRESFSRGSAPGDPGVQAPGAGAGKKGQEVSK